MVKNVRWLYNKLGTVDISATGSDTISGGINAVQNNIDGKANASHTHGVGDLPVSNSSVNSTSYVPSSAVVYGLQSTMSDLSADVDDLKDQASAIPNSRYVEDYNVFSSWNSQSDVDAFMSRFNSDNLYSDGSVELALGHRIFTRDGSYNISWIVAGFDLERNRVAADGTTYNNGCGICLIPESSITTSVWNTGSKPSDACPYMSSTVHSTTLPNIMSSLKNLLGSHLVTRNVLLSSSLDSNNHSNGYTWTTAEATLMSVGQCTGTFTSNWNKYDDGEATYKLPLFDHENFYASGNPYWTRGVWGVWNNYRFYAWMVNTGGGTQEDMVGNSEGIRPMIYIR